MRAVLGAGFCGFGHQKEREKAEGGGPTFLFYHHQHEFASGGAVSSALEAVVYNANVPVPNVVAMICQSSAIFEHCEYDCSSNGGIGGILCSCTADEKSSDSDLPDDGGAQSCLNSALLIVPQSELNLVTKKQRSNYSTELQIAFANGGDNLLLTAMERHEDPRERNDCAVACHTARRAPYRV